MSEKLKSCPGCGGQAEYQCIDEDADDNVTFEGAIACINEKCGLTLPRNSLDPLERTEDLIARWNALPRNEIVRNSEAALAHR
jgi:hypothetical protein